MRQTRAAKKRAEKVSNIQKRRISHKRGCVHCGSGMAQDESGEPQGGLNEVPQKRSTNSACDTVLVS